MTKKSAYRRLKSLYSPLHCYSICRDWCKSCTTWQLWIEGDLDGEVLVVATEQQEQFVSWSFSTVFQQLLTACACAWRCIQPKQKILRSMFQDTTAQFFKHMYKASNYNYLPINVCDPHYLVFAMVVYTPSGHNEQQLIPWQNLACIAVWQHSIL